MTLYRLWPMKHHTLAGVLPALCLLGYSCTPALANTLPEELIGATEGFLEYTVDDYLQRSEIQGRHEIRVSALDPRLNLASCDEDLTQSLQSSGPPLGRVTVKVSCESGTPWSIFVPAQVSLYREVVILVRPLKREEVIGLGDIGMVEKDVGTLGRGYLTDPEQALGRKVTRTLQADLVLTPNVLQLADAVHRGDQVMIIARSGNISVRMPGEALANGVLGEQISVRNAGSKRVIRARIIGPGQVEAEL